MTANKALQPTALASLGAAERQRWALGEAMHRTTLIIAAALAVFAPLAAAAPSAETLTIDASGSSYSLTVPVSRLTMVIPKETLEAASTAVGGSTNNPRYFYFEDKTQSLIISGWFEPARAFQGLDRFWESETGAWKQNGLPEAQDVSFTKVGNWDAIIYDQQHGLTNSHVRAHWIQAGTWIDIHLSLTSKRTSKESRKLLESILKAITVKEKP